MSHIDKKNKGNGAIPFFGINLGAVSDDDLKKIVRVTFFTLGALSQIILICALASA